MAVDIPFSKEAYFLTMILFYTHVGNCCSNMKLILLYVQTLNSVESDNAGDYFLNANLLPLTNVLSTIVGTLCINTKMFVLFGVVQCVCLKNKTRLAESSFNSLLILCLLQCIFFILM